MISADNVNALGNLLVPVMFIIMGFCIFFFVQESKFARKLDRRKRKQFFRDIYPDDRQKRKEQVQKKEEN